MSTWNIHRWDDIGFVALSRGEFNFRVYQINGWDDGAPNFDTPEGEPTGDFGEAEVFCHGSIRFDGCLNMNFPQDSHIVHLCGRTNAVHLGRLMSRLYDLAAARHESTDCSLTAERLPHWPDCAIEKTESRTTELRDDES